MWDATFTEVKWVGIYIDESIMLNLMTGSWYMLEYKLRIPRMKTLRLIIGSNKGKFIKKRHYRFQPLKL